MARTALTACGDVFGGVLCVVGAGEEDDDLRGELADRHVVHAPEDVLGAVGADAEVEGVAVGVVLFPGDVADERPVGAGRLGEVLGDGVADEEEVNGMALRGLDVGFAGLLPAMLDGDWVLFGDGGDLRGEGVGGRGEDEGRGQDGEAAHEDMVAERLQGPAACGVSVQIRDKRERPDKRGEMGGEEKKSGAVGVCAISGGLGR